MHVPDQFLIAYCLQRSTVRIHFQHTLYLSNKAGVYHGINPVLYHPVKFFTVTAYANLDEFKGERVCEVSLHC